MFLKLFLPSSVIPGCFQTSALSLLLFAVPHDHPSNPFILLKHHISWPPVGASKAVPKRGELPVVVFKLFVMDPMAGGAIDDGTIGDVLSVVCKPRVSIEPLKRGQEVKVRAAQKGRT